MPKVKNLKEGGEVGLGVSISDSIFFSVFETLNFAELEVGYCVIFLETSKDSFSSSLSIVSISTSFLTDSSIFNLYEYMQDIIENKILKGMKKNDFENDAIDKDDEIDSIEVDVQQEFGLTVNIVNLAYETQQCFVLQRVLDPHLRA